MQRNGALFCARPISLTYLHAPRTPTLEFAEHFPAYSSIGGADSARGTASISARAAVATFPVRSLAADLPTAGLNASLTPPSLLSTLESDITLN
jgi:hypothetical protein